MRRSDQKQLDLEQREQFDQMSTGGQYDVMRQGNGGMDEFERFMGGPFQRQDKQRSYFLNIYKLHFFRHFEKSKVSDSPRQVLFAQLLPSTNKKTKNRLVQSVLGLAPMASWHYSPGAKKIDVISRLIFPATFAGLNVIYWSYYLTKADNAGKGDIQG